MSEYNNITYKEFIYNIINTRGKFNCEGYCERHHIIPKCLGGSNDEENLIDLYAREHFIAHKLLAQENPDNNSLMYAWSIMAFVKRDGQDRYQLTPEEFEEIKIANYKARCNENNSFYGKHHSEETKKKLSTLASQKVGRLNPNYGNHKLKGVYVGEKNKTYGTGVSVIQLTLNGDFIREYVSAQEAENITGIFSANIRDVYNHKNGHHTAGGYIWMTKEEYYESHKTEVI